MNAAKAKKNPAKVKGAVLIMILAVMTVLIILLAGSIAVVYSAHNRAYVKYSESQGYYTARSILDNFFSELTVSTDTTDASGASIGTYNMLDLDNGTTVAKDLCMGRSLELELYKVTVSVKDASNNYYDWFTEYCDENEAALKSQILGFDSTANVSGDSFYNEVAKYYVNLYTAKLNDTGDYGDFYDQYTPVSTGDTIIYEVDSLDSFHSGTIDTDGDGNPDTNSMFGKLSDSGSGKAWLTVQVTERIFAMGEGTTYADRFKKGKRTDDHIVAKVTAHVIYDGEEITTTQIWYNNPPPVVDADTGLSSLGPINDDASMTGIGDVATLSKELTNLHNNSTFSGNVYIEGSCAFDGTDPYLTIKEGEVFFVGDTFKTNANKFKGVNEGSIFYADRFQLWSNDSSTFTENNTEINLITNKFETHSQKQIYGRIFAENFDTMSSGGAITYPDNTNKNSIANGNMLFSANNAQIHGDVYCNYLGVPADRVYAVVDNTNEKVILKLNYKGNGTALAATDSNRIENMMSSGTINVYQGIRVINGVEEHVIATNADGSTEKELVNRYETYTDGTDYFTTFKDGADFMVPETGSFLVLGGDTIDNTKNYKIEIDFSNVNTSIVKDKTGENKCLSLDYNAPKSANVWTLNDRYYKEFTLPTGMTLLGTGENTFALPTHRSIYGNYFYEKITSSKAGTTATSYPNTFDEDTGAFTMSPTDPNFTKFLQEHAITAEAILANVDVHSEVNIDNVPAMTFMSSAVTVEAGGGDTVNGVYMPASDHVISSSGYIVGPSDTNDYNNYFKQQLFYIDARSNDIEIQLGDGVDTRAFAGGFVVYGDNHVTVTVPGLKTGGNNQTVEFGGNGSTFFFDTAEIFETTGNSYDAIVIGTKKTGKCNGELTSSPNIDWYFSSNITTAKFNHQGGINGATNNCKAITLCGYITAPSVKFDINTSINGVYRETYYYGDRIPNSGNEYYTFIGSVFCKEYRGGQHAGVCYIPRDDSYVDDGSKPLLNKVGMYRSRS